MPLRHLHHNTLESHVQTPSSSLKCVIEPHSLPELDYFDTIVKLQIWAVTNKASKHDLLTDPAQAQLNEAQKVTRSKTSNLLVCHDFKGGYTEDPFDRGYSFEFCFSHNRITIPPRGWLEAGRRHGSKVLGTAIFEWTESKPDLQKCLYGEKLNSTQPVKDASALSFSTEYASHLITLAQARQIDGYLLNIETDLNFIPPVSSYPGGSQAEQDEDLKFYVQEKFFVGVGALISPEVRSRRAQRMEKNANALIGWVGWLRSEGKRRVGPHWEIIWYDSVTTAGKLQWQDALTPYNAPFFVNSDAIFTNYTWARPSDPSPPGALPPPAQSHLEHHPALLKSAHNTVSLKRPTNEVYMGIDVFGRNCYGGFDIGLSLDMIFPSRNLIRTGKSVGSQPPRGEYRVLHDLGLSVALFAPGWTWEREKDGGGERTWAEWWEDELRFWYGRTTSEVNAMTGELDPAAVGDFFGPRERSLVRNPSTLAASLSDPPLQPERTGALVESSPNAPVSSETRSSSFYTNFNRGSGTSWWVRGHRVYDALVDTFGKRHGGWTDMGSCFPKPDKIWPIPTLLDLELGGQGFIHAVDSPNTDRMAVKTALIDHDVWEGGTSLEIQLETYSSEGLGPAPATNEAVVPRKVLPLCTLHASHVTSSDSCSVEVVVKRVSVSGEVENLDGLRLRPYILRANNKLNTEGYRVAHGSSDLGKICKLANGWYSISVTVNLVEDISRRLEEVVPVVALEIGWPLSPFASQGDSPQNLKLLVGAISVVARQLPRPLEPALSPFEKDVSPLSSSALLWNSVPLPSGAPSGTIWGYLTWGAPGEESSLATEYYNVFVSRRSPEEIGLEADVSEYLWLGTSTYELDPNSFVIAGLELSDVVTSRTPEDHIPAASQSGGSAENFTGTLQQVYFMVERVGSIEGVRYTCKVGC